MVSKFTERNKLAANTRTTTGGKRNAFAFSNVLFSDHNE